MMTGEACGRDDAGALWTNVILPGNVGSVGRSGSVRVVEAVPLEFYGDRREDLAHLRRVAFGAYGYGIVLERLIRGEIISAVLAAVVICGQRDTSRPVWVVMT